MKRFFILFLGFTGLAVWILVLDIAFRTIGLGSYLRWCLANGSTISLGLGFVALIWKGLDLQTELLSWHPVRFVAGCFSLVGVLYMAAAVNLGGPMDGTHHKANDAVSFLEVLWDGFLATLLNLVIGLLALAWLVIGAPFHYVLSLFTGAPARRSLRGTGRKLVVLEDTLQTRVQELEENAPLPEGGVDVSFSKNPMALTSALNAAVLFVLKIIYF